MAKKSAVTTPHPAPVESPAATTHGEILPPGSGFLDVLIPPEPEVTSVGVGEKFPHDMPLTPTNSQGVTLHPETATAEVDKAVIDVPTPTYMDTLIFLRGGDKECWVLADDEPMAREMFTEWAEAHGEVVVGQPLPLAQDYVMNAIYGAPNDKGERVRRVLLSPWHTLSRKAAN